MPTESGLTSLYNFNVFHVFQSYTNARQPELATLGATARPEGQGGRRPTRRADPSPRTPRAAPAPPLATLRYSAARATGGQPKRPPPPPES